MSEEDKTFESSSEEEEDQKFNILEQDKAVQNWKADVDTLNKGKLDSNEVENKEKPKRKRAPPKCSICIKNGKTEEEAKGHNSRTCPLNPSSKEKKAKGSTKKINTNIVIPIIQQELKELRSEIQELKDIIKGGKGGTAKTYVDEEEDVEVNI